MTAAMSTMEVAGVFTAVVTGLIGLFVLMEKITGALGRWFQRQFKAAAEPHNAYVAYHLGPNGDTTPIHIRLEHVEEDVARLKAGRNPDIMEPGL